MLDAPCVIYSQKTTQKCSFVRRFTTILWLNSAGFSCLKMSLSCLSCFYMHWLRRPRRAAAGGTSSPRLPVFKAWLRNPWTPSVACGRHVNTERCMHSSLQPNSSLIPSKNDPQKLGGIPLASFISCSKESVSHFLFNRIPQTVRLNSTLSCVWCCPQEAHTQHTCGSLSQKRPKRSHQEAERR